MEKRQRLITIVVALITNPSGEVLLAKRHQPDNFQIHDKWEFPGGGIEFGEDPEMALIREVKEETGLEIKIVRLLPKVYSNIWDWTQENLQVLILSYQCTKISGELDSSDIEIGELGYFKPDEVDYQNSLPKTKEIIAMLKL